MRSNNFHFRHKPDFSFQRANEVLEESCLSLESGSRQEALVCQMVRKAMKTLSEEEAEWMGAESLLLLYLLCVYKCMIL